MAGEDKETDGKAGYGTAGLRVMGYQVRRES
jgi:hypothetical protein